MKLLLAAPFTQQADRASQKWEASRQEKRGSGKHYPKAKVWGIVRAALAVALTEWG